MVSIIENYDAIASRQKQIAIEEGQMQCPTCQSVGWHQFCDEEGCCYWNECETCENPFKTKSPAAYAYGG